VHPDGVSSLRPLRSLRATLWLYLSLVALSLFWLLLSQWGVLRPLENLLIDARYRIRGAIDSPARVVYVDIDSPAIRMFGNFPWNQAIFARVCAGLIKEGGAKAIGIDVVFSEAGVPNVADMEVVERGRAEFARYLFTNPPVVLAASYAGRGRYELEDGSLVDESLPMVAHGRVGPPPEMPDYALGPVKLMPLAGLIDAMDGDTRQVPIFAPLEDRPIYHLSVELARLHWGLDRDAFHHSDDRLELRDREGNVVRAIPLQQGQIADINWFSRWDDDEHNPRVSIARVFYELENLKSDDAEAVAQAKAFFADDYFKDAIVLIGPVDKLLQDLAPTAFDYSPVPKVGVHGNMVKTIVSGRFLKTPPQWALPVITIGLTALVVVLSLASEGGRFGTLRRFLAAGLLVGYVVLCFTAFSTADWVLPMVEPLGAAFSSAFIGGAAQLVLAQKQKSRIKGLFGAYLAPAVVNEMVDAGQEPKLGGVEENITAYFSDVESFSAFSEKLSPTQLVELMNEYLTASTDIVQAEGGTLDKYVGDAVVAMFGAPLALPDHPLKACVAALRVQRRDAELREKWRREPHKNWPDIVLRLRTRIGLNSGRAVVGNMGSASRFSYTMMGDTVNLAARMESGAKAWGVYTMCADPTRMACEAADTERRVVFRALGRIVVKGRSTPVPIHELVGLAEEVSDRTREAVARFEAGLEKYYAQDWDAAAAHFQASAKLEPNQPDPGTGIVTNPSLVYLNLVAELRAHPPGGDWNGVYVMKGK
jgi:Adenylate cyclase, family 3 (some proteins contain HAMP domain)